MFWIGTCKGRWDLIFGIWSKNIEEFFHIHDEILNRFSHFIQEKELSISRESIQYNRRWMYNDNSPIKEFNFGEKDTSLELNEKNKKILNELVSNSRQTIVNICKKTDISLDIVRYRIKTMEKENLIKGYKLLLNPTKLNFNTCKAFIFFKNIDSNKKKKFITYCKNLLSSVNIVITFAPWDLEIMFETKSYEEFFNLMDKIKDKFNDIIKYYESVLITSEPKQSFVP